MSTPPFNSPYQQALKSSSTLLQQPAYPSPARSDTEPPRYPSDGLGLYTYTPTYPSSGPTSAGLYPPSPQPTEAWAHLTTGASPLLPEGSVDSWTTAYEQAAPRSPHPWAPHHASNRSSLSSARDMSILSRASSEHEYSDIQIKLEGGSDWHDSSPALRQQPLTVSPDRLTTVGIFPYDQSTFASPPLSMSGSPSDETYPSASYRIASCEGGSRSPQQNVTSHGVTPRTRTRRTPTTPENAQYTCHLCGKLFQRSYNHKTHMETHNPIRKREHVCTHETCDKSFVRKTDLDRHTNSVHRKLKVFRCNKCDSHFARKDTLRRHEEDGCPRRNELRNADILSRRASMRTGPFPGQLFHSPHPSLYEQRSPPLFRDHSFSATSNDY